MPTLTRPTQPMPEDIDAALHKLDLRKAYDARPPYQRNDYLRWIAKAKRTESRERRMGQMLRELAIGGVYMGMSHAPSARRRVKPRSTATPDQAALNRTDR